jgi:hypothetical protein
VCSAAIPRSPSLDLQPRVSAPMARRRRASMHLIEERSQILHIRIPLLILTRLLRDTEQWTDQQRETTV